MARASDTPNTQNLGSRALRGTLVTTAGQGTRMLIQVTSVVVLARLLTAEEYGLFGMVLVVAGVAEIFRDFGLSNAAIQAPTLSRAERDNLFWLNTAIGATLAILVVLLAWPTAAVFGRSELVPLVQGMSIIFVLNGLATQYRASLSRSLRFVALTACDVLSALVGVGCAIALALAGFGTWALVGQLVAQSCCLLVALVIAARWRPGLPHRSVPMGSFLRFGRNMVGTQLLGYAGNNADAFIIGVRLGAAPLGIYNRAFQLLMNPVGQLRAPISNVAIPVLSRLQGESDRYWNYVRLGQLALGYLPGAALGIAAGAATPITEVFLGRPWMAAAPILQLLTIAALMQTLAMIGYWVYVSQGLTGAFFRYNLVSVAIKVLFVVVGSTWGPVGVAGGFALSAMISVPLSFWWLSRSARAVPVLMIFAAAVRVAGFTLITGAAAYGGTHLFSTPIAQLVGALLSWVIAYAVLGLAVPRIRHDLQDLVRLFSVFRGRGASRP